ncbi:hypothetical protein CPCC7001_2507 [Cyanobium sp. PCC 7001]|nr:hypothetical protein CPCC7001_2507 [Cyanobium sp. PCC 7001]
MHEPVLSHRLQPLALQDRAAGLAMPEGAAVVGARMGEQGQAVAQGVGGGGPVVLAQARGAELAAAEHGGDAVEPAEFGEAQPLGLGRRTVMEGGGLGHGAAGADACENMAPMIRRNSGLSIRQA